MQHLVGYLVVKRVLTHLGPWLVCGDGVFNETKL